MRHTGGSVHDRSHFVRVAGVVRKTISQLSSNIILPKEGFTLVMSLRTVSLSVALSHSFIQANMYVNTIMIGNNMKNIR